MILMAISMTIRMTSKMLTQMRRGLLVYVVLLIIKNSRPSVSINELLQTLSSTEFATSEGTLYPLLSKLARERLVIRGWEDSDEMLGRKYYYLTAKGRTALEELGKYWKVIVGTVSSFSKNMPLPPHNPVDDLE